MGTRQVRYAVLLGAGALLGGVLLTGCSGGADPSPPPTGGGTVAAGGTSAPTTADPPATTDPTAPSTTKAPASSGSPISTKTASRTTSNSKGHGSEEAGAPGVPKAARQHTNKGAEAFARHYIDVINETGVTPTVGRLEVLATSGCRSCSNFAGNVRYMKENHEHQVGTLFLIRKTGVITDPDPKTRRIRVEFSELPVKVVNKRGKTTRKNDPGDGFFEFVVGWTRNGWTVEKIYAPAT